MKLYFDIAKLQKVADDFFLATGIGIYIIAGDFSDIKVRRTVKNGYCHAIRSIPEGRARCQVSDEALFERCRTSKRPEISICHGGLVNIAAPIIYGEDIVGYVFFYSLKSAPFEEASQKLCDLGIDRDVLRQGYSEVPEYYEKRFESVISIAVMLIQQVIVSDMIKPAADNNMEIVKSFIDANLSKDLTVKSIIRGTNVSKSALYRLFSKYYGVTVSEYVNQRRVELSESLLLETDTPITEIARLTGFNSITYFRMVFKRIKGDAPSSFRKKQQKK